MNWIDLLWMLLALYSGFSLLVRRRLIIKKINILNYMLFSTLIIYISETLQTITHMSSSGYILHMMTYTAQASLLAYGIYCAWPNPWFAEQHGRRLSGNIPGISLCLILMSCLMIIIFV
ncbi:hypothetical protein VYJ08_28560 (plasmid) [Klebsiella pneumoniae]|uniref:Uncharacterized protein n=2 Tax=Klebsiella/Raoultella group TaxID=2890311 RepID=A0A2U7XXB3_KLEPN|nr:MULTISPECIES: hypothetical protein [Enterobacteriaceae]HBR2080376.1 hypothetical protein [Klebsiella quasipneumoniae subsp. quasipneumoniae]AVX52232.1 hypothetical protein pKP91-00069 [Klebsiella pneumoniae]AXU00189.1 hypothetical protein BT110_00105 [Klebsiella pneumoniae]AZR65794.1 hypothetical protein ELE18_26290 [Klebsiella quasipneumoniae]AZZ88834.1 hypothetical protein [Raoultella ornithinolytica]